MLLHRTIFSLLLTCCLISACQANSTSRPATANSALDSEFIALLDYEIQNRAFALMTMEALASADYDNLTKSFFEAYLALEKLNQSRFAPYAIKYQLSIKPRWWTKTRTQLGLWFNAFMPETYLSKIHQATINYVAKLEKLQQLSPAEDSDFFAYVVAQEKVQAQATGMVLAGDAQRGAKLLQDFVNANSVE